MRLHVFHVQYRKAAGKIESHNTINKFSNNSHNCNDFNIDTTKFLLNRKG